MRRRLLICISTMLICGLVSFAAAPAHSNAWDPWKPLLGNWVWRTDPGNRSSDAFRFDIDSTADRVIWTHRLTAVTEDGPTEIIEEQVVTSPAKSGLTGVARRNTRAAEWSGLDGTKHPAYSVEGTDRYAIHFSARADSLIFVGGSEGDARRERWIFVRHGPDALHVTHDLLPIADSNRTRDLQPSSDPHLYPLAIFLRYREGTIR